MRGHRRRLHAAWVPVALLWLCAGCGDDAANNGGAGGDSGTGAGEVVGGAGGQGGQGAAGGTGGAGGAGGAGGEAGGPVATLDELLDELRMDVDGTLLRESREEGWPVHVAEGFVVVTTDPTKVSVPGDHDAWVGVPLTPDLGFAYAVLDASSGDAYKLFDGASYEADPWARAYDYDPNGEKSLVLPTLAHLERHLVEGDPWVADRELRVWVPVGTPTHVLYVHDGQNLFDPEAIWGGWHLQDSAPPAMLIVGIDNTPARMDEYTHVGDELGGVATGGEGDAYADFVETTVRGLVADVYGEPPVVGVMGSSLGGLISLHIADRFPGEYDFAASLSGTLGWGSIELTNETMIERYAAAGHQATAVYLDSGGGGTCFDSDGDGIEDDDLSASDNYCETAQLRDVLAAEGYAFDVDLWHWYEPDAPHNEAAWAARVWRPLDIFASL